MLVERLGMRRLSHTALAVFIVLSARSCGGASRRDDLLAFIGLMVPLFYLFGLIAPNFNAMAMEPQGDNAGMASSVIGFVSTGDRRAGRWHGRSHIRRHGAAVGARLLRFKLPVPCFSSSGSKAPAASSVRGGRH